MAPTPILFDAVIFDLDGTLVATERYWVAAAMRGAQRAFEELGLQREVPGEDVWLSMVGLPLERAFERAFADLEPAHRARTMELCVEEEHAALDAGGAAPMPGAFEVLHELKARGIKLGIASNCSQAYLAAVLDRLIDRDSGESLRAAVEQARCLDSARVRSKTDMIRDLLDTFATRSAVMVGDRATDAEAAHANAIPHVHLASGLAPNGERVECEATIHGLPELLDALSKRARWIEDALRKLGALGARERGLTLGITGRCAAGKSYFARDAVRVANACGVAAQRLSLDSFPRTAATSQPPSSPDDHLSRAFDLALFSRAVLEPRGRGEATLAGPWGPAIAPDALLVVDGIFLADPRLRPRFDRLIHLSAPDELLLRRSAGRDSSGAELMRMRRDFLPAHDAFEARFPPASSADLVLDVSNSLATP